MILVGGAYAMASYLMHRNAEQSESMLKKDAKVAVGSGAVADDAQLVAMADDATALPPIDATEPVIDALDVVIDADLGSAATIGSDAGAASNAGSGEEIELDPNTAEDLDPARGSAANAQDEAADAPKTKDEAEQHAPVAIGPQLATNVHDAVQLIKDGKRADAMASLRALQKKSPKSAYIPFLLGNLYFDQMWWGVGLEHYAEAIKKNNGYRNNPVINRNVIKMLSSGKTQQRAVNFLRGTIGHPAGQYLRYAAAHDPNPTVKKQAAMLARVIR
jgi:TolA-binding protein